MPNLSLCKSLFDAIGVITQCFLWKNGTIKRVEILWGEKKQNVREQVVLFWESQ